MRGLPARIAGVLVVVGLRLKGVGLHTWAAEVPKELQVPQAWIDGGDREHFT